MTKYVVNTSVSRLEAMNGYTCNSESKDHFLRHLGYRFAKTCGMTAINNAYESGDLMIDIYEKPAIQTEERIYGPKLIKEFWGEFGYKLELDYGEEENVTRVFTSDVEAHEWLGENS